MNDGACTCIQHIYRYLIISQYRVLHDSAWHCTCLFTFSTCRGCDLVGHDKENTLNFIKVDPLRMNPRIALHTLFHVLGRYHEHQRSDRRPFIPIIHQNIIKGRRVYIVCVCRFLVRACIGARLDFH